MRPPSYGEVTLPDCTFWRAKSRPRSASPTTKLQRKQYVGGKALSLTTAPWLFWLWLCGTLRWLNCGGPWLEKRAFQNEISKFIVLCFSFHGSVRFMEAHSGVSRFWDSLLQHAHTNRKAMLGITHPQKRNFACCFDLESILANFIKSDQALSQDHSLWEHREPMTCWSAPRTLERFAEILSKCRDQDYMPRIVENPLQKPSNKSCLVTHLRVYKKLLWTALLVMRCWSRGYKTGWQSRCVRVALKRAHGIVAMTEDPVRIDSTVRLCEMTYEV